MTRRWLLALPLLAACYSTPMPNCAFRCGPGNECPASYICVADDGMCHLIVNSTAAACPANVAMIDAPPAPAIDAPPATPDSPIVMPDAPIVVIDAPEVPDAKPAVPDAPPPKPDAAVIFDAPPPPIDARPPTG